MEGLGDLVRKETAKNMERSRKKNGKYNDIVSGFIPIYEDYLIKKGEYSREHRGYSHFHPSAYGDCRRKMAFQFYSEHDDRFKLDLPIDPKFSRICDAGHAYHHRMQTDLSEMGILKGYWKCRACGKIIGDDVSVYGKKGCFLPDSCPCQKPEDKRRGINLFEYEEIFLKSEDDYNFQGHCDGVIEINGEEYIIDFKSIKTSAFQFLSKPDIKYVVQVMIYMWLLEVRNAIIFYEDKSEHVLREFVVPYDEEMVEQIKSSSLGLKNILLAGKIPGIPKEYSKKEKPCKWCDYVKLCYKGK